MSAEKAADTIRRLREAGFEAYYVGGCVRDGLIGRPVYDYDIASSALPEEVISVFGEKNVIPTGIKHGTVTVNGCEVTTFRVDGEYLDSRRPESVSFTRSLEEDLARRDFTMNAIAMDENGELRDPFGGLADIKAGIIRCVGDPEKRFSEDALRILRALRFSAQLGFDIEEKTAAALLSERERLKNVSYERLRDELDKLICGKNCVEVLLRYRDVIAVFIPEFVPCFDFDQRSPYHKYDVWEHILRAMDSAPREDLAMRRTMLFHDIAKPERATFDENGRGHFKGHDARGAEIAADVMKRLRWDNKTIAETTLLISRHSIKIRSRADVKRVMSDLGDELFFRLIDMKKYDNNGKREFLAEENRFFDELAAWGRDIIARNECRNIASLAVNGDDLAAEGLSGKAVGDALRRLLGLVIDEELPNDREALISYVRRERDA